MNSVAPAIRTLIVDDERPARLWLRTLCSDVPGVEVIGECATAGEASRMLRADPPDLLLLDIQLGGSTGFQVLDGVPCASLPSLVFVTAHDHYAVDAFERRAIDYLLKPVQPERFRETIDRVRLQIRSGATSRAPASLRQAISPLERSVIAARRRGFTDRLIAERGNIYQVIDCRRIVLLESEGNYVRVTETGEAVPAFMRGTLQKVVAVLDPDSFVRISRSVVVNFAHVEHIGRNAHSQLVFHVAGIQRSFSVGRSYHRRVSARMKPLATPESAGRG